MKLEWRQVSTAPAIKEEWGLFTSDDGQIRARIYLRKEDCIWRGSYMQENGSPWPMTPEFIEERVDSAKAAAECAVMSVLGAAAFGPE